MRPPRTRTAPRGRARPLLPGLLAACVALSACGGDLDPVGPSTPEPGVTNPPTQPPPPPPPPPTTSTGAGSSQNSFGKEGVKATGAVTETADGLSVNGGLSLTTQGHTVEFVDASMSLRYDESGRVVAVSGTAKVPPPSDRIQFAEPLEADIGLFSGAFLNRERELPIRLQDDTDYFVYRIKAAFEMRIATGETGANATKPLVVRAPIGGEILMIVDYTDPMYYVYGAQDLIGDAGIGRSFHGRIPFVPDLPVNGLGTFDGQNTRTGSFTLYKVIAVSGQMVDNETSEVHLALADPFATDVSRSYQAGYNGEAQLDLFFKDFVGLEIPLGRASGGVFGSASLQNGLGAHAYVRGETADFSWWPTFLPVKPASSLDVEGFVQSTGAFGISLEGQYGWQFPFGTAAYTGRFSMSPDSIGLTGGLVAGTQTFEVSGGITNRATSLDIKPPTALVDLMTADVQARISDEIASAEKAWNDLQKATGDYEIELSLRGLRTQIPGMVDYAKAEINRQISSRLSSHSGTVYYSSLRNAVYAQRDTYFRELDALKAAARQIQDNAATRKAIEDTLRRVAARKIMTITYRHKVLGITVKTVTVSVRVLTDAQAAQLLQAADHVKYIKETSDLKLQMQQIYDTVPGKELFEKAKAGLVNAPLVQSVGMEILHQSGSVSVYVILGGQRHSLGQVNPFDVPAMAARLAELAWKQIV
ncbi:MAG: hypothetical protein R3E98_19855 [Gemmatimonadota bacterium]